MNKSQAKAQFIALAVFSAMYFGAVLFVGYEPAMAGGHLVRLLLNLDAYLAFVASGYLAAAISKRRGIATGALAGVIAGCLVAIYHLLSGPVVVVINDWRFWLIGILLGGFGGLLWILKESVALASRSSK
jgi:hypothetical protein